MEQKRLNKTGESRFFIARLICICIVLLSNEMEAIMTLKKTQVNSGHFL